MLVFVVLKLELGKCRDDIPFFVLEAVLTKGSSVVEDRQETNPRGCSDKKYLYLPETGRL